LDIKNICYNNPMLKNKRLTTLLFLAVLTVTYLYLQSSSNKTNNQSLQEITKTENVKELPRVSILAQNLEIPWDLAFLPDKSALFTERAGRVRLIDINGSLRDTPVLEISDIKLIGEGGLLGITAHPDFSTNNFIFLYYTYSSSNDNTLNKVVRYKFSNGELTDKKVIVDNIPGATFHNGGRLKFGPDGFLYITTGDAQKPSLAQDKNSLAGKILRVTDEGGAAPGNPFNTLIYSYGHRNPQGLAWDSSSRLWETEHGNTATDEVNLIEPGKNYGWPEIRGSKTKLGMVSPVIQSGNVTWAPTGAVFFNDTFYFTGLRGNALYALKGNDNLKEYFKGEFGRLRSIVLGPDNMFYVLTSNKDGRGLPKTGDDKILRINPEKL